MRRLRAACGALLLVAVLPACSEEPRFLEDSASCPGPRCSDDARQRRDAIAALEGVTTVEEVARSSRLDRGSSSTAVVGAAVTTAQQARAVGLEVLRELAAWPDHEAGTTLATVRSDPPVAVPGEVREVERLTTDFYDRCTQVDCAAAVSSLSQRLTAEVGELTGVSAEVVGDRLVVEGRADRDDAALAARAAVRLVRDLGVRVAEEAQVTIRWRAPLAVTLRLEEGRVCEQPPGVVVGCDQDNSEPFSG